MLPEYLILINLFINFQHVFKGTVKDFIQKVVEVFEVVLWNEEDIMVTDHMVDRTSQGKFHYSSSSEKIKLFGIFIIPYQLVL